MKNVMYVQIMGHEYPVEANPGDELYVNRLAQYVEEKMRELKQDSKIVDSYKLAVMAAMNIADELFRLQESRGARPKRLKARPTNGSKFLTTPCKQTRKTYNSNQIPCDVGDEPVWFEPTSLVKGLHPDNRHRCLSGQTHLTLELQIDRSTRHMGIFL